MLEIDTLFRLILYWKRLEIVGYNELGYKLLIGLTALPVLLIALIQWWRAKPIARFVGIAFTVAGVISLVGTLVARFAILRIVPVDIPVQITATLPHLIRDFAHPWLIYSIGILIAGIGLIIFSVRLRSLN